MESVNPQEQPDPEELGAGRKMLRAISRSLDGIAHGQFEQRQIATTNVINRTDELFEELKYDARDYRAVWDTMTESVVIYTGDKSEDAERFEIRRTIGNPRSVEITKHGYVTHYDTMHKMTKSMWVYRLNADGVFEKTVIEDSEFYPKYKPGKVDESEAMTLSGKGKFALSDRLTRARVDEIILRYQQNNPDSVHGREMTDRQSVSDTELQTLLELLNLPPKKAEEKENEE